MAEKARHLKRFSWENVQLLIKLIDIRSSYIRDVLERQGLSEEKMGRGSPICERVRKKIVEYFKNNVPQCQIAKAL